jgi:hypothetical protein
MDWRFFNLSSSLNKTGVFKMSHLPVKTQTVAIFWDLQNVNSITKNAELLLDFANAYGSINCKNSYYSSQHKNQVNAKNKLELLGFKCVDVPDSSENSADARLTFDCTQLFKPKSSPTPNIIILVLGDWDFAGLICILKSLGKKVIVFAQKGSVSPKLIKLVGDDNFHFIDELSQLVGKKTQDHTTVINHQISYNEAVEYLIVTVKQAINQGKTTNYGYISQLMRQLYPKYQGIRSISTPNGKKFKTFGKFVDAVVNSGKIQRQNQELFLIELNELVA